MRDPYGIMDVASVPVAVVFSLRVRFLSVRLLPIWLFARMLTCYFLLVASSSWMMRVPFFFVRFVVFGSSCWVFCWMVLLDVVIAVYFPCKMSLGCPRWVLLRVIRVLSLGCRVYFVPKLAVFLSVVLPSGAVSFPLNRIYVFSLYIYCILALSYMRRSVLVVGFWYVSVAIAKSFFRIRVFVLLCVSIDIVVGV